MSFLCGVNPGGSATFDVIPAKAGIHSAYELIKSGHDCPCIDIDPYFRRDDN